MTADQARSAFGERAARLSVYTPIVVIVLAIASITIHNRHPIVAIVLGAINLLLIVAGLVLGIIALISMRRLGRRGILVRAIIGVAFSGAVLLVLLTILLPAMSRAEMKGQLVGTWQIANPNNPSMRQARLTFNGDRTFVIVRPHDDGVVVTLSGTWTLTSEQKLVLDVAKTEHGDNSVIGERLRFGTLKRLDANQAVLEGDNGEERLIRVR